MSWLVVGAGAIGSVVGGLLAKAGESVWLLGRPWHLEPIRQNGLVIRGILGEHRITSLPASVDPGQAGCHLATRMEELPRQRWDRVLVTVKSFDTASVAKALPGLIAPSTLVISLQNGLGNWEALAAQVPIRQLVGGRVIFGVELKPGIATVTVWGGNILLGPLDSEGLDRASLREQIRQVAERLTSAGLKTEVTDRIRQALWGKVIYNCALNPLSTLLEVPYGRLLESEATQVLMRRVVEEAYRIAFAEGIELDPPKAEGYTKALFEELIPATAQHHPSMLQDLKRGRRTEIDALNGAIVRLGSKHRVATPANAFLTELILVKETSVGFEMEAARKRETAHTTETAEKMEEAPHLPPG